MVDIVDLVLLTLFRICCFVYEVFVVEFCDWMWFGLRLLFRLFGWVIKLVLSDCRVVAAFVLM